MTFDPKPPTQPDPVRERPPSDFEEDVVDEDEDEEDLDEDEDEDA